VLLTQSHEPYGGGTALLVLALWAAAAMTGGHVVLRRRDA
jgi:ABC-2 type transport system permease protein